MKFENFEILLLLLRFPLFAPVGIDFAGRRGKGNGRKPKEKKKKEATEWNGGRFLLCAATEKLFCTGHWPVKEKPKWLPVNNLFSIGLDARFRSHGFHLFGYIFF